MDKKWLAKMYLTGQIALGPPEIVKHKSTELPQPPELSKSLTAFLVDRLTQEEIIAYKSGDWKDEISIETKKEILRREKTLKQRKL